MRVTADKYGVNPGTINRWRKAADGKGLNGPPRPRGTKPPEEGHIPAAHFDDCPACLGTGKRSQGSQQGLYVPEGSTIDDIRVIFRVAGVEDLGIKNRGRGSGSTMRSENQTERTGRVQARDRRQEEHP